MGSTRRTERAADRATAFRHEVEAEWECVPGQNLPARGCRPIAVLGRERRRRRYGDPLDRRPEEVLRDVTNGLSSERPRSTSTRSCSPGTTPTIDGVDDEATTPCARSTARTARPRDPRQRVQGPGRERLIAGDIRPPGRALPRRDGVLAKWAEEFRTFWDLPDDFEVPA